MDAPRDQLFASAGLAEYQHRGTVCQVATFAMSERTAAMGSESPIRREGFGVLSM